jgi:hypothetical protein
VFDGSLGFDVEAFDNYSSAVLINGVATDAFLAQVRQIGTVDLQGNITIAANTRLVTGNIWYNPGAGTATDGTGLYHSNAVQAVFLKAAPAYTP